MKNKGFTIVEILGVIVIIGILIGIAVPVYNSVTNSVKQRTYDAKVDVIKAKVIEYASDNYLYHGSVSVNSLLQSGYLEMDNPNAINDFSQIVNPFGGYLDCDYVDFVYEDGDYVLNYHTSDDCTFKDVINKDDKIKIYVYESNGTLLGSGDNVKWTDSKELYLLAKINSDISPSSRVIWQNGVNSESKTSSAFAKGFSKDTSAYSNVYKVSSEFFLNATYIVTVQNDKEVLSSKVNVKIDREKPTVTANVPKEWTNGQKEVTLIGSDGNGSGVKSFYYSTVELNPSQSDFSNVDSITVTEDNKSVKKIKLSAGTFYIYAKDAVGNISDSFKLEISNVDLQGPECLVPINNPTWSKSYTFTYGCKDNGSGCVSTNVTKTYDKDSSEVKNNGGVLNTLPEKLTWTIKDAAGNTTECEWDVHVKIDTVAPTCVIPTSTTGWTNQDKTISWGCEDKGSGCTNEPQKKNYKEKFTIGTYNTESEKTAANNGKYFVDTYTIKAFTVYDEAGNSTICSNSKNTDGNHIINVHVDKIDPVCTYTGENKQWTKDNVTISWGCSDVGSGCSTDSSSKSVSFTSGVTEKYSVGEYTIKDKANNEFTCKAKEVSVYVDKEAPQCIIPDNPTDPDKWINTDVSIKWGCNDGNGSGCSIDPSDNDYKKQKLKEYNSANDTKKVVNTYNIPTFEARDAVGNKRTCNGKSVIIHVDKEKPKCLNAEQFSNWSNQDRTVTWGCNDGSGSGCRTSNFSYNTSKVNFVDTLSVAKYTVTDFAGNSEDCPAYNISLKVDKVDPTCDLPVNFDNWTKNDRTISWGCSDTGSGCSNKRDGNDFAAKKTIGTYNTTSASTTANNGIYSVENYNLNYDIYDAAGNTVNCSKNVAIKVDKIPPVCAYPKSSNNWTFEDKTVSWGCASDTGSGCKVTSLTSYKTSSLKTTANGGKYTVDTLPFEKFDIYDNALNVTHCDSTNVSLKVDKEPPSCILPSSFSSWTKSDRTISWGCSDTGSGCSIDSKDNNFAKTKTLSFNTAEDSRKSIDKYTIKDYTARDAVGNQVNCKGLDVNILIDKEPPTCFLPENFDWSNQDRTVTWGCNDSGSGCTATPSKKDYASTYVVGSYTTVGKGNIVVNSFNISDYTVYDAAGNSKTCSGKTEVLKVDKEPPSCILPSGFDNWTKNDRSISWGCSDGNGSGCSIDSNDNNFTKTKTTSFNTANDSRNTIEKYKISAYTARDAVGNTTSCATTNVNILVDKDPPLCSYSGAKTSWNKVERDITWGCEANGGSPCDTTKSGGGSIHVSSGTVVSKSTGTYRIYDEAGNSKECGKDISVMFDAEAPSCKVENENKQWTNVSQTIIWGCDPNGGAPCKSGQSGGQTVFDSGTVQRVNIPEYTIADTLGNERKCNVSADVYLDKEAPECYYPTDAENWTKNDYSIDWGCREEVGSKCKGTESNSKYVNYFDTSSMYSSANRGNYSLEKYTIKEFEVEDKIGNKRKCAARDVAIKLDKIPPTCNITNDYTSWTNSVDRTVTWGCSDSGGSNCKVSQVGKFAPTGTNYTIKTFDVPNYSISDGAGNSTPCGGKSVNVLIDKQKPKITYNPDSSNTGKTGSDGTKDIVNMYNDSGMSHDVMKGTTIEIRIDETNFDRAEVAIFNGDVHYDQSIVVDTGVLRADTVLPSSMGTWDGKNKIYRYTLDKPGFWDVKIIAVDAAGNYQDNGRINGVDKYSDGAWHYRRYWVPYTFTYYQRPCAEVGYQKANCHTTDKCISSHKTTCKQEGTGTECVKWTCNLYKSCYNCLCIRRENGYVIDTYGSYTSNKEGFERDCKAISGENDAHCSSYTGSQCGTETVTETTLNRCSGKNSTRCVAYGTVCVDWNEECDSWEEQCDNVPYCAVPGEWSIVNYCEVDNVYCVVNIS